MVNFVEIYESMKQYISFDDKDVIESIIDVDNINLLQLRDTLTYVGDILEENIEKNMYIVAIKAGTLNMNSAIVAVVLEGNRIIVKAIAKEGIINQKTSEKAIKKLQDAFKNESR